MSVRRVLSPTTTGSVRAAGHRSLVLSVVSGLMVGLLTTLGTVHGATSAAPVGLPPSGDGGTVTAWGSNGDRKARPVPDALNGKAVTAIAGSPHSLALTSQGTVVGWDFNG